MKREPLTVIQVQRRNTIDGRAHNPGLLGWRALAYCPAADAPAELERQRARFGHHEPTLEFRSRTANGAQPHAHIPPQTVALGCALDLTTQFRDVLTNWDFEVKGWRMVCAPDAMEQAPGRAVLYLLRTDTREQNAHYPIRDAMSLADALVIGITWLGGNDQAALHEAIDKGDPDAVRRIFDSMWKREAPKRWPESGGAAERKERIEQRDAWRVLIQAAKDNEPRETNGATNGAEDKRADGSVLIEWAAERIGEGWIAKNWINGREVIVNFRPQEQFTAKQQAQWHAKDEAAHYSGDWQIEIRERHIPRTRNPSRDIPEHAAELYERWNEREAEHVTDVDGLPDLIGIYVGRAMRIGYSSDKWNARGKSIDYEHDFSERGHIAPECWADTADLADARALAIVGGTMRITEDGID